MVAKHPPLRGFIVLGQAGHAILERSCGIFLHLRSRFGRIIHKADAVCPFDAFTFTLCRISDTGAPCQLATLIIPKQAMRVTCTLLRCYPSGRGKPAHVCGSEKRSLLHQSINCYTPRARLQADASMPTADVKRLRRRNRISLGYPRQICVKSSIEFGPELGVHRNEAFVRERKRTDLFAAHKRVFRGRQESSVHGNFSQPTRRGPPETEAVLRNSLRLNPNRGLMQDGRDGERCFCLRVFCSCIFVFLILKKTLILKLKSLSVLSVKVLDRPGTPSIIRMNFGLENFQKGTL
jgi:hypothetical protein